MADIVKLILPPSPNWYCSAIGDCSINGVYAFGARNCIYFFDVKEKPPTFISQITAHNVKEWVTAISWSRHELHSTLVASSSEGKTVRVWDFETKICVAEHNLHQVNLSNFDKPGPGADF